MVGICYRPSNQEEEVDWKNSYDFWFSQGTQPPQHLLEGQHCREQAIQEVGSWTASRITFWNRCGTNGSALLDLLLTNKEKLVRNMIDGVSYGYNGHEMAKFSILGGTWKVSRRLKTRNFRRTDFRLFREMVGRIPREAALKGKGCPEGQRMPWRAKGLRRTICSSQATSLKHKSGPFQCARIQAGLAEMKVNLMQSCISKNTVSRFENNIISLYSALVTSYLEYRMQFEAPWWKRDTDKLRRWPPRWLGGWRTRRGWASWGVLVWRRKQSSSF